ncbi:glycine--tRNA ligase subunit beta [Buchnera aphidicola]|uniref:glycine--tRNA ligase subunit beta n=1 Tax=Buchnera aphidicola TaxID=9 RepID=UPI0031B72C06
MNKNIFLIELIIEDLPALQLHELSKNFLKIFIITLKIYNITWDSIKNFSTLRRLSLKIKNLKNDNLSKKIRIKGPSIEKAYDKNGTKTKNFKKWIKKFQIPINKIQKSIINKKEYLTFHIKKKPSSLQDILKKIIPKIILKIPCKNSMYWNQSQTKFIRPVRNILILLNKNIIPVKLFGLISNRLSTGHFILSPSYFSLKKANEYTEELYFQKKVIINYKKRKQEILKQINTFKKKLGCSIKIKKSLINEITSLVEWPKIFSGKFPEKFLKIPKLILIHVMEEQQKYLPTYQKNTKILSNNFLFINNIDIKNSNNVILGNEKVLCSRFDDVLFFLKKDVLISLEKRINLLKKINFHNKLGTLFKKIIRMQKISLYINKKTKKNNKKKIIRAISLSKCDLTTLMVAEYPKLQGIIGYQYSKFFKEDLEISNAIQEHYYPKYSTGPLPKNSIAQIISIADKLDSITGLFSIHEEPQKNYDPYASKRAAIGIIRIIIENNIQINISKLIQKSLKSYNIKKNLNFLKSKILFFLNKRFIQFYTKKYPKDIIKSVLSLKLTNFVNIYLRILNLHFFQKQKNYLKILLTYKRINNILKKTNFKFKNKKIDKNHLKNLEKKIFKKIYLIKKDNKNYKKKMYYLNFLKNLEKLCILLEKFFKTKLINHPQKNVKFNRLLLLYKIKKIFFYISDFSYLKIKKKK